MNIFVLIGQCSTARFFSFLLTNVYVVSYVEKNFLSFMFVVVCNLESSVVRISL